MTRSTGHTQGQRPRTPHQTARVEQHQQPPKITARPLRKIEASVSSRRHAAPRELPGPPWGRSKSRNLYGRAPAAGCSVLGVRDLPSCADPRDPADRTADRAAFLTRKTELFTRIADQHPRTTADPPPPSTPQPPSTPPPTPEGHTP